MSPCLSFPGRGLEAWERRWRWIPEMHTTVEETDAHLSWGYLLPGVLSGLFFASRFDSVGR